MKILFYIYSFVKTKINRNKMLKFYEKYNKIFNSYFMPKNKLVKPYVTCGLIWSLSSFTINMMACNTYREYYFRMNYSSFGLFTSASFYIVINLIKFIFMGIYWSFMLSDLVYYNNEKTLYSVTRFYIPWHDDGCNFDVSCMEKIKEKIRIKKI